jgi:uncharacterized protein (DUF1499 family)
MWLFMERLMGVRSFLVKFTIFSGCAVGLAGALLQGGCTNTPDKPETMKILQECGWLPNCVNTQSSRDGQSSAPLKADARQWKKLKSWIAKQQDWEIIIDESNFVQAVVKSPLMRFRDDVQLLFLPDVELIHVRSSSRLGISDMGVNAERIETLRNQIDP